MNYTNKSFQDIRKQDIIYLKNILFDLKNNLTWDEGYYGYLLNGEKPLTEYLFEETNTIINPKELIEDTENIILIQLFIKNGKEMNEKEYIQECLNFLPKRFRKEFLEILSESPQDIKSIRKNHEYFIEDILNELTEKEKNNIFVCL